MNPDRAEPEPEPAPPVIAPLPRAGAATGASSAPVPASWPLHLVAIAWIAGMLLFASEAPDRYAAAMQEDRVVEWWTALLFGIAGVVRMRAAVRDRRMFDGLVALFCLFVAGEEISWGQRLVGFIPPASFLEHNTQQEFNLHNFAALFGRPKWPLILALLGFGLVLPLVARVPKWGGLAMRAVGATAPRVAAAVWLVAAAGLLVWYPVEFTGEWVEWLAALLFLWTAPGLAMRTLVPGVAGALAAAVLLTALGDRQLAGDPARLACARAEVAALLQGLVPADAALTRELLRGGTIHKRVWSASADGYVNLPGASAFHATACAGASAASVFGRRQYAVDPWGTAYWIRTARLEGGGGRRVLVYSFGPNRRRDGEADARGAVRRDDVVVETVVMRERGAVGETVEGDER